MGFSRFLLTLGVMAVAGCGPLLGGMLTTQVAVDRHELSFTAFAGDVSPGPQTIVVECYDPGSYYYGCGGSLSVDQPWILLDRSDFYGADAVSVSVDHADLEPGTYEGKISVNYDFVAIDDSESVTVELVVQDPAGQEPLE